jgi:hypothetical protein
LQLKENPERELRRLLDFLRVSVSNSTIQCVMDKKEGIYKRSKRLLNFSPFDDSMKSVLAKKQKVVFDIMKQKPDEAADAEVSLVDAPANNETNTGGRVLASSFAPE